MSLNVLVSAAVQKSANDAITLDEASKKKRKRVKGEFLHAAPMNGSSAASLGSAEDEEEKQRKRRAQIAEASRRSRARRKKEFQDFKEENDQLWSQNMMLRRTLEDMGVVVAQPLIPRVERGSSTPGGGASHNNSSDDEDGDDGNQSLSGSPAASPSSMTMSHHVQQAAASAVAFQQQQQHLQQSQQQQLHWVNLNQSIEPSDSAVPNEPSAASPSGFPDFCLFFERRLSWYFTQLKSDAIRSFASHLPYEEKQKLASLQVKLVSKDGLSPTSTPATGVSVAAARQVSASHAEQAVDQDKNVRL